MAVVTNREQYVVLANFMEDNPSLAKRGLLDRDQKQEANILWEKVTKSLNAKGPPEKDVAGWKKVWKDFKYHTKLKYQRLKDDVGESSSFISPLEQNVLRILGVFETKLEKDGELSDENFNNEDHETEMMFETDLNLSGNLNFEEDARRRKRLKINRCSRQIRKQKLRNNFESTWYDGVMSKDITFYSNRNARETIEEFQRLSRKILETKAKKLETKRKLYEQNKIYRVQKLAAMRQDIEIEKQKLNELKKMFIKKEIMSD